MCSAILGNHLKKNSGKEKYDKVNPDIKKVANEQLDYWLGKIVSEIPKKKEPGSVYPPNTLYQMWFKAVLKGQWSARTERFRGTYIKHFQDCLDAEVKRLTNIGVGSTVKQAEPLCEDPEQKLWNSIICAIRSLAYICILCVLGSVHVQVVMCPLGFPW